MIKQLLPSIRSTLVLALLTGIIFPFVITAIAQIIFPVQSNGSLIRNRQGAVVASRLLAQSFTGTGYFHPRPSAAGAGYAGETSGATNLGPTSAKLIEGTNDFPGVRRLAARYRTDNGLPDTAKVPVDAVTRSGSGLDPDISVANALLQAPRVARARNLTEEQVKTLVQQNTSQPDLGLLGEPRVNVLMLNLALDGASKAAPSD